MLRSVFVLLSLIFFLSACDAPYHGEGVEAHWYNDREYQLDVYGLGDERLLTVDVSYNGKSPLSDKKIKHDWRVKDTDFYNVRIRNVSDYFIKIERIEYRIEKGSLRSQKTKHSADIKKDYGKSQLVPTDLLDDNDAYVWAEKPNVLHRSFVFNVEGRRIGVDIPLVYKY